MVLVGNKRTRTNGSDPLLDGIHHQEISRSTRHIPPAHYLLKIESYSLISTRTVKYDSAFFEAGGYQWRLSFYPNGDKRKNINNDHISLYLEIATNNFRPRWEVNVNFKLFVYDQIKDIYLVVQDAHGAVERFHETKTERGFEQFLSLESFKDPSNGYLVNNSCVFGAEVLVIEHTNNWESLSLMEGYKITSPTFRWKITNFSMLDQECYESREFTAGGSNWKIRIYPKGETRNKGKSFSMFLNLIINKTPIYVECKLRVLSQASGMHVEKSVSNWFGDTSGNTSWGHLDFISLEDLYKSSNGYIVSDSLIVDVEFINMSQTRVFSETRAKTKIKTELI